MKLLKKLFGKEANPMAEKLEKLINEDLVNIFILLDLFLPMKTF